MARTISPGCQTVECSASRCVLQRLETLPQVEEQCLAPAWRRLPAAPGHVGRRVVRFLALEVRQIPAVLAVAEPERQRGRQGTVTEDDLLEFVPPEFAVLTNGAAHDEDRGGNAAAPQYRLRLQQVVCIAVVDRHDCRPAGQLALL